MSATTNTRTLYTRHIALIMAGVINSALSGFSLISGHLPDWTQYIEANILPIIAFFLDFANARVQDYLKGGSGQVMTNVITNLGTLSNQVAALEKAVKNFPIK